MAVSTQSTQRYAEARRDLFFKLKRRHFHLDIRAGVCVFHAVERHGHWHRLVWCKFRLACWDHHDLSLFDRPALRSQPPLRVFQAL